MPLYADGISNLAAATGITSKEDKSTRIAWNMAEIARVAPTESSAISGQMRRPMA